MRMIPSRTRIQKSSRRQTAVAFLAIAILFFVLLLYYIRQPILQLSTTSTADSGRSSRSHRKSWQPVPSNYQPTIKSAPEPRASSALASSPVPGPGDEATSALTLGSKAKFLYMIQTESCLSDYLQEVVGDSSMCPQCDVLVLSYKTKCGTPPPSNVEYIYVKKKTSWGGGRNVLYETAMKREQVYLYFILMDDDIVLTDQLESERDSKGSPWRKFEEFLERIEPAAAAVDISNKHWLERAANGRKYFDCQSIINASTAEYVCVADFDAAFNAFHNKSVRHILPYTSKFDRRGMWNFCPIYINIKLELLYAGHLVLHNQIFGTNAKHRSYPKCWPNLQDLNSIADEVESDILEIRTKNSSLLSGWRRDGLQHEQRSPTVCIPPPPPKMPIVEFAYIDSTLAV